MVKSSSERLSTLSYTGQTNTPLPLTIRNPTSLVVPSGSATRCLRPEITSTWLGPTLVYRLAQMPMNIKKTNRNAATPPITNVVGPISARTGREYMGRSFYVELGYDSGGSVHCLDIVLR